MIAGALRIKTDEKQALLEERNVTKRMRMLSELLAREVELVEIGTKIQTQVQSEMEKGQREWFLRQQMKAIQEELGEFDEQELETQELRQQLEEAGLPEYAMKQAERELGRFERLPPQAAEHGVLGASGITGEYPVMRHAANLESVLTYEGTSEVHQLVIGQALTGENAFG